MIRSLWFLVKIAVVVGVVVWVAERPGSVRVEWLDYVFTVHVGLFLLALLGVIVVSIFLYRVVRAFVTFPSSLRYYNEVKGREKGYRALTVGLTAVAAGDTAAAMKHAEKARKMLPEDEGLALLLKAQAARLDGREEDARESFVALLENKDAAFLGVRGLLQASLDTGDTEAALQLARRALDLHPKQKWILRTVYDLEIRGRHWGAAADVLTRAVRSGAIRKERAMRDRAAMALAIALEAEDEGLHNVAAAQFKEAQTLAAKIENAADGVVDSGFVPAAIVYAQYLMRRGGGQRKKAVAQIEKAWKAQSNAVGAGAQGAFVPVWAELMPVAAAGDPLARLKWFERLVKLNPQSAAGQMAAGQAAMDGGLWGEARKFFERAEELRPSAALYKAFAALEDRAGGDGAKEAARKWIEKAGDAPGDRVWVCRESGRVYEGWHPIAEPHGSFNTIEWNYQYGEAAREDLVLLSVPVNDAPEGVLETPPGAKVAG